MKMTYEEAIKNHRDMWNWIADQYERNKSCGDCEMHNVDFYKEAYIKDHFPDVSVKNNCFMCEYAKQMYNAEQMYRNSYNVGTCTEYHPYCLLYWGNIEPGYMCEAESSPYLDLVRYFNDNPFTSCEDIDDVIARCREIANLPLKKIVNNDE